MATIEQLPSGKWRVKVRKQGFHVSRTVRTQALAKQVARQIEDAISVGQFKTDKTPGVRSFADIIKVYLSEITPRKKSWKVEKYILKRFAVYFDGIEPSGVVPEKVLGYVSSRQAEGCAPATIIKDMNKLSHVWDTSISMGWMESLPNPVRAVKKVLRVTTTLKEDNARERRLRASEEGLLLESRIGHVIEFALETGMRRGEICNIKPEHIRRNTLLIPETKTGKPRTIPLSVRAREILGSQPGFEYRPRTLSRIFLEVCRANGIEDLRFHDLRHEATSRFFEKGLSIEQVALITGHTDWRSLRRYTHLDPAEIAKKL